MDEALFQYSVRVSPKAKNPRLKVSLRRGLEIVLPKGYDDSKLPVILRKKRHWIKSALERVELNRKFFEPKPEWRLPTSISLPAISETWHLECRVSEYAAVAVRVVAPSRLLIFGRIGDEQACTAALRRWIHRRAKESLVPMLEKASKGLGLRFSRVFIKRQRTRWASCSRNRTISLNVKLLFLKPELVEYCMTHELCHIAEMNHTKKFWSLVRTHLPDYQRQDRMLRDAWKTLPRWV